MLGVHFSLPHKASNVLQKVMSFSSACSHSSTVMTLVHRLVQACTKSYKVVSNREMRPLFDSMKEMGEIMRRQNAKVESMAAKLEDNSKEVNKLKEQLKTVLERGSQTAER